jgi:hypothetical protein
MTPQSNSATKTKNLLQQNLLILKAKFFEKISFGRTNLYFITASHTV